MLVSHSSTLDPHFRSSHLSNDPASGSHLQYLLTFKTITYTASRYCFLSLTHSLPRVYDTIIMQTRISNTMSHTSHISEKTSLSWRQNSSRKVARNRHVRSCMFRIPWQSEFSPIELVKDLAERVTNALRLVSLRRSLHRDSPSLGRSKSAGVSVDSYRTAAVEDCIEFIHSSFSRSNSSTTTSREDSIHAPLDTFNHKTL